MPMTNPKSEDLPQYQKDQAYGYQDDDSSNHNQKPCIDNSLTSVEKNVLRIASAIPAFVWPERDKWIWKKIRHLVDPFRRLPSSLTTPASPQFPKADS
jgi:hypothetical protein